MNIAVCLTLYSTVVAVFAPRLRSRITRRGIAPALGVAVWLAAI